MNAQELRDLLKQHSTRFQDEESIRDDLGIQIVVLRRQYLDDLLHVSVGRMIAERKIPAWHVPEVRDFVHSCTYADIKVIFKDIVDFD